MKFKMYRVIIFSVICAMLCDKSATANKPHIILIIGDDIGWNDFSFHGSNQIPTPNIDALGYNGVFLNRFYTQGICTPSRSALLTGKYPIRYGFQGIPIGGGEDRSIPREVAVLPEKLKNLGYKTHLVGKWHLGGARKNVTPTARGFDTHFGYWHGFIGYFDYFNYQDLLNDLNINVTYAGLDLHDRFEPQWKYQGRYATELFTEKSLEIIDNHNSSEPLFLYLGHLAAHTGANGTELGVPNINETEKKYSYINEPMRRRYADVVCQLDKSVGQVVKKLKEKEMLENSIVLFLSDNGAQTLGMYENFGSNYPLKGLKFTLLEGGVRGSAVLYSPLLEKKGYINNHLIHITDMFPTLLHAAGWQPGIQEVYDGINQWETISRDTQSPRKDMLLNINELDGYSGIVGFEGQYKLLNGSYGSGIYDGSFGDTGRQEYVPAYDLREVLDSEVNKAIQSLSKSNKLTKRKIKKLRKELDISSCNGKVRTEDPSCLEECLFDLWNDPCETVNIIKTAPTIRAELLAILNQYIKETVPAKNKKVDPNSNPQYCNNTWFPWLDEEGCYANF